MAAIGGKGWLEPLAYGLWRSAQVEHDSRGHKSSPCQWLTAKGRELHSVLTNRTNRAARPTYYSGMPDESLVEITRLPESDHTSESEEMYIITVARETEEGRSGPVPVAAIAANLEVSVASANEMVRKLAGRDLLIYEPYRGVELTAAGHKVADRVLRIRRLWATFLVDHLGFGPTDADDQACQLEHVTTGVAADRLAAFLGDPETGPLGRPISHGSGPATRPSSIRLIDLGVGDDAEVVSVACADRTRRFLTTEGIVPGAHLTVVGVGASGLLLDLADGVVHINDRLADTIGVRRK